LQGQGQHTSSFVTDIAHDADMPLLVEMVARHEGGQQAGMAEYWLDQQRRENIIVFRDADGQPAGFLMLLALHQASQADIAMDLAAYAAWSYLRNHAPLRAGESATLFRYWMARDTYQDISPVQSLIADLARIPGADYEIDGRAYGVYGHDWRVTPPLTWLAVLA
jgi:hypothetical protein